MLVRYLLFCFCCWIACRSFVARVFRVVFTLLVSFLFAWQYPSGSLPSVGWMLFRATQPHPYWDVLQDYPNSDFSFCLCFCVLVVYSCFLIFVFLRFGCLQLFWVFYICSFVLARQYPSRSLPGVGWMLFRATHPHPRWDVLQDYPNGDVCFIGDF